MSKTIQKSAANAGLLAGIAAYVIWGVFPVYFKITESVPPLEILAHRVAWSVPFGAAIILLRRQWPDVWRVLTSWRTLALLSFSAILIALNWGLYIWAVQNDQIFQASLGYYINPLIFVIIGVAFLGESLKKLQITAVILAAIGVGVLTIYGGKFPWIALTLAISFTAYGVIRKQVDVGAMPGLFIETLVLLLPALGYLIWLYDQGALVFSNTSPGLVALLVLAGPITVLPLVAFAFAARRLRLSTLGFLQFIGPTLQFIMGLAYGERFTLPHLICFSFIWLAVILFMISAWRTRKKA